MPNRAILLAFAIIFVFALSASTVFATTTDVTGTVVGHSSTNGYHIGHRILATSSGSLHTLGINWYDVTNAGNFYIGIYADDGTGVSPTTLLAQSAETTISGSTGFQNVSVSGVTIIQGTYYWIAINTQNDIGWKTDDVTPTDYHNFGGYSPLVSSWTTHDHTGDTFASINVLMAYNSTVIQTVGDTSDNSGFGTTDLKCQPITATANGTLQSVGINLLDNPTLAVLGFYDNTTGDRLAYGIAQSGVSGWNTVDLSSFNTAITAGHTYCVAISVSSFCHYYDNPAGTYFQIGWSYDGTVPSAFSGASAVALDINAKMIYDTSVPAYLFATFNYSSVNFGTLSTGTTDNSAPNQLDGAYNITVNTNADYKITAIGNEFWDDGAGHTFSYELAQLNIAANSDAGSLSIGDAMVLSIIEETVATIPYNETVSYQGFWISIPAGQYAGNYTNTVTMTVSNV